VQTDNVRPYDPLVLAYFLGNRIQIYLVIALAEQPMRTQFLHSRALRHVAYQLIQLPNAVSVALDESVYELAGVAFCGRTFVVMILAIVLDRRVKLDDVLHQPLLADGGRRVVDALGHPLHTFTSTHVLHQRCRRPLWRVPHISAGNNYFRHRQSPPFCHSLASSNVKMPFTLAIS
jgi:hypothetical protein